MNILSLTNIFHRARIFISILRVLIYVMLAGYHSAYGESETLEPTTHKLSQYEVNFFEETKRRHKEERDKKHWLHEKKIKEITKSINL
jgi:hypothetical protein